MIRVGLQGAFYVVMMLPGGALRMTEDEAADLHAQLGALLPDEKLNVEAFSTDPTEAEVEEMLSRRAPGERRS